jgi:FkbM family methyltransferase
VSKLADENCIVENMAIGKNLDEVEVFADGEYFPNYTSNILGHDSSFKTLKSIYKVKCTTLDDYFKDIKLDYLKIDTEGSELDVIKGGIETIKKCKYVVIECHYEKDWPEIFNLLKQNELDFKSLTTDKPIFIGECEVEPGLMSNGMSYQIYLKQN